MSFKRGLIMTVSAEEFVDKLQADFKTCLFFRHGKRFLCQIGIGRT